MRTRRLVVVAVGLLLIGSADPRRHSAQQLPLAPTPKSGSTVTPAFEGWYPNPDGTRSISFGYYNRNSEEALDIPIGPNNLIAPGDANQGQPTHFEPKRHWGVFAVKVPADFGSKEIVWTLRVRGQTFAIPGNLHPNWQIDALEGEAGSGNTPPVLKFSEPGPRRQRPVRRHDGPAHGHRRHAPFDHRVGERRRQGRGYGGDVGARSRARVADMVSASGPRRRDVHAADRAHSGDGWIGDDLGRISRARRLRPPCPRQRRLRRRARGARAVLLVERLREGDG